MPRLEQKNTVITGASRGIGRGIALAFAREGARVIVNYYQSREQAEQVVAEIGAAGGWAYAIQANVSDPRDVERFTREAEARLGGIDIWVNNAGADILTGPNAQLPDPEKLDLLIKVDLLGTINCCWAVAGLMKARGGGVFVNMSWDLAIHGFHGHNPQLFAAVKAAVLGFSRAFAKSCGPEIRVNILAPGWIETAFAADVMDREYYKARLSEIPLGRFGTPEDVAEAAVFLASDESSYMTGEMIKVNGGLV